MANAAADDFSRIPMSHALTATLGRAADYARAQGHTAVTLEHLLLALTEDADAEVVFSSSNLDMARLKADVSAHLGSLTDLEPPGPRNEMMVSPDLRRILEAAAAAAQGGRRREINGAIVLAAIIGDGKSPSAHMLLAQGLTFEQTIRALMRAPTPLARTPSRQPEYGASPTAFPPSTDDVLASARERVMSRSIPGLGGARSDQREKEAKTAPADEPSLPPHPETPGSDHDDAGVGPPGGMPEVRQEDVQHDPQPTSGAAVALPDVPQTDSPDAQSPQSRPLHSGEPAQPAPPPAPGPAPMNTEPARPLPPPAQAAPGDDRRGPPPAAASRGPAHPGRPGPASHGLPPGPHQGGPNGPGPSGPGVQPGGPGAGPANFGGVPAPSPGRPGMAPPAIPGAPGQPPRRMHDTLPAPTTGRPRGPEMPGQMRHPSGPPVGAPPYPGGGPQMHRGPGRGEGGERRRVPTVEIGKLVENIPRRMRVAVPTTVEVRIAKSTAKAIADGLQGPGAAWQHEVTITKAMSVRLRSPGGGFWIETTSPETQWIENRALPFADDFASWRWTVTPRTSGRKKLQLVVSARTVGSDGLAAETALPDQIIEVKVRTNYGQTMRRVAGWTLAAVVGGLLAKFGEGAFTIGYLMIAKMLAG
jgi:hypothetical protein